MADTLDDLNHIADGRILATKAELEALIESRERAAREDVFMALIATAETVGALDGQDIERMRQTAALSKEAQNG
jgi:hypothetical protein